MRALATISLVVLASCGVRTRAYTETKYQPKPESHPIDVYLSDTPMDVYMRKAFLDERLASQGRPPSHIVIGTIEAYISFESSYADAVKKARREAREAGGDALLLVSGRRPTFSQEATCLFQILRYQ